MFNLITPTIKGIIGYFLFEENENRRLFNRKK
jgi:hypothetical protein